jgi:hypothetical protein
VGLNFKTNERVKEMKKILFSLLLLATPLAFAQHWHHGHNHGQWRYANNGWNWVVPAIVGGVLVYEVSKNQPPQQPIVIQQTIPPQQNCSPWTETQHPDGTITRTRTCTQ